MSNTRTTENFSITFPLEMLRRAQERAREENRTMSELLREAYRRYERKTHWDEIINYGSAKASILGIQERDVVKIVKESRKERKVRSNKASR